MKLEMIVMSFLTISDPIGINFILQLLSNYRLLSSL
jgi:hypothetical protein